MQNRISRLLAAAVGLALLCNASIAAAAPRKPGAGAPPTKIMGSKKASKIGSVSKIAGAAATANPTPSKSEQFFADKAAATAAFMKTRPAVPGQMIVKYKPGVSAAQAASIKTQVRATTVRKFKNGAELVQLPAGASVAAAASALAKTSSVEYVEPNYIFKAASLGTQDTAFPVLWGMENVGQVIPPGGYPDGSPGVTGAAGVDINAPQAWEITEGSGDVVVAVMDTGIDFSHPDLQGRQWVNPGEVPNDGIDNDGNGFVDDVNGFDFVHWDGSIYDEADGDEHGTHVSGTIAGNINGQGVVGVAPQVKIASVKFLDHTGSGTLADAVAALEYIDLMGFKIANHSWSGDVYSQAMYDAFVLANDTLHVVAAGNEGTNLDDTDPATVAAYPAGFDLPNILTVAAVNNQGGLAEFSNYGLTSVDVAAPGVDILSSMPLWLQAAPVIMNNTPTYKSVVAGFGLEELNATDAADLVDRVLAFFGADANTPITVVLDDASGSDLTGATYPNMKPYFEAALAGQTDVNYITVAPGQSVSATSLTDPIVFWTTGQNGGIDNKGLNLTATDLTAIDNYLVSGGKLFLSGQEAIFNNENHPVVLNRLGVYFKTEGDPRFEVQGLTGTPFAGATYTIDTFKANFHDTYTVTNGITTAFPAMTYAPLDDRIWYGWGDGTSMAAPHVTGVAALVRTLNPNMSPVEIKNRIMTNVSPLDSLLGKTVTGGMVDAFRAVSYNPDNDIPGVPFPKWGARHVETLDGTTNADMDDVYRVNLRAGDKIKVWLDETSDAQAAGIDPAATDYDLYLFGPGTPTVTDFAYVIAQSDAWYTSTEYLEFVATTDGIYYIDVFGYTGSGKYVLRAEWGNGPDEYQDTHPGLKYAGGWLPQTDPAASGGTYKLSTAGGHTMDFRFYGEQVALYAVKGPTMGLATVTVNGESTVIDLFSTTVQPSMLVYAKGGLPLGPEHNMTVRNNGMRSPLGKKSGIGINIDRIDVRLDTEPPTPVQALEAMPGDGWVELSWLYNTKAVTDFDYFAVYRALDGGELKEVGRLYPNATTAHTSSVPGRLSAAALPPGTQVWYYKDATVQNGNLYNYVVYAVDRAGNLSSPAGTSAHPDDAPAPVAGVIAINRDGQVILSWLPNPEADVENYEIYRKQPTDANWGLVTVAPHVDTPYNLSWTDTTVTNEQSYTYAILAVDEWNVASESYTPVNAHPSVAPAAVQNLTADRQADGIHVSWTHVGETGLTFLVKRTPEKVWSHLTGTSLVDTEAAATTSYTYQVYAYDQWGVQSAVQTVTVAAQEVPLPPTNLVATQISQGLEVTWTPSASTGIVGYKLYRSTTMGTLGTEIGAFGTDATSYIDVSINWDQDYYYSMTAQNSAGTWSAPSAQALGRRHDNVPPTAPTGLHATNNQGNVTLAWTAATDNVAVHHYELWRTNAGMIAGNIAANATSYIDNPPFNNYYEYYMFAVDAAGNKSPESNRITISAHDNLDPEPVTGLTATPVPGGVQLNWTPSTSADVHFQELYRSTTAGELGSLTQRFGTNTANQALESNLTYGTTYYFTIIVVDNNGRQSTYATVSASPLASVVPPQNVTATPGDRTVTISWDAVAGAEGYNVYRANNTLVNTGLVLTTSLTHYDLSNGINYCFYVTSVVGGQESAMSATKCATPEDTIAPDAPTNLTIVNQVNTVDLSWNVSLSTDMSRQEIYRNGAKVATLGRGVAAWTDNTVALNGTDYTYYVLAVDDDGLEAVSNSVTARPHDGAAPLAPTGITLTAGDGSVLIEWAASMSPDVTGYNVYRSTIVNQMGTKLNGTPLAGFSYNDTSVTNGTTYFYTLTAVDFTSQESAGSLQLQATPQAPGPVDNEAPSVPTNLQAAAGDKSVNLSWTASTDNVGVSGYTVYWGTGSTEPTTWNQINVTGTSWQQSMLVNGTTYWYKVVARDGAGNVSSESAKKWAMPNVSAASGTVRVDSANTTAVKYTAAWNVWANSLHSGGSLHYSGAANASAELSFTGTAVKWIASPFTDGGFADVFIDGVKVATVDCYSATRQYQKVAYERTDLGPGVHTIKIVRTGAKNPAATNTFISVDAFDIR